jgi:hypothetical protein
VGRQQRLEQRAALGCRRAAELLTLGRRLPWPTSTPVALPGRLRLAALLLLLPL